MMKKKTFFIINICVVLLFAIYLVTALFIDYPKYVKIIRWNFINGAAAVWDRTPGDGYYNAGTRYIAVGK